MVDDDDRRDRGEEGRQFSQQLRLEIDDDVPAQRNDPLGERDKRILRRVIDESLEES